MNHTYQTLVIPRRDVAPTQGTVRATNTDDCNIESLQNLLHEIRQPLGVIESLAYYLEMIATDPQVSQNLQTIRSMVVRVNHILEEHRSV